MKRGYNCAFFSFDQTVTMAGNMIPYENDGREIFPTTENIDTTTNQTNVQSGFRTFWTNGDGQARFPSISITNLFASNQRNGNAYQSFSNR